MILKIISTGFWYGADAYLVSRWHQLDFSIICVSYLSLAADAVPALRPLKALRVLRVLRPLRIVSRSPGMRLILNSLSKSLASVFHVISFILMIQLVFALVGMQLFRGR